MNILRFLVPKSSVEYISIDATVRQAYEKMRYHSYVAIPVLDDDGIYIGTLRRDDIYKYFFDKGRIDFKSAEKDKIADLIDKEYSRPLYHSSRVEDMMQRVREHNFVPVVDDRGCFIGIVLRRDVLDFLFELYKKEEH
ncbi:MAG: CBS domain-containing protein [Clostridia bacterium]|nr:CBS domain-containing protein [Clostridia bacterium]